VVGDVERNADSVIEAIRVGAGAGARVVVSTELVLSGYPPRDLLDREDLVAACRVAAERVATATAGTQVVAVYGTPWDAGGLRNTAVVAAGGQIVAVRHKALLPTYDVFDEARYFAAEATPRPVEVEGLTLGVTVCEDIWNEPSLSGLHYRVDPVERLAGCDLMVNLSASPFQRGKRSTRAELVSRQARQARARLVYCNQVGGNDELVFDGGSMVADRDGRMLFEAPQFVAGHHLVDLDGPPVLAPALGDQEEVVEALTLGVRDYVARCGFTDVLVGLSGGIDSALVAVLAARALGPEHVWAIGMPGPYSSPGSVSDAEALARNLGSRFDLVPVSGVWSSFLDALAPVAGMGRHGLTEENLQSRVRGTVLMALSNRFGHLLLTTGNKSEMAVGYCTLYGDMNGGLAPLADLYKTEVYDLACWLNREREIIPRATLEKPPSAELAPGQVDQDSLPPYPLLDAILRLMVEGSASPAQVIAAGHDPAVVARVAKLLSRSEFKRWQAAPGLRISSRAFGGGRRVPLAQRWG